MILLQNFYLIKSSINIQFRDLLKSSRYEALVGELMNKSQVVFPIAMPIKKISLPDSVTISIRLPGRSLMPNCR